MTTQQGWATTRPAITVHTRKQGKGESRYYEVPGHPNPTRKDGYWRSVTTTLNKAVPKPGLPNWARDQAYDSVRQVLYQQTEYPLSPNAPWLEAIIQQARAIPTSEAADYGTDAHAQMAAALAGVSPTNPSAQEFLAWWKAERLQAAHSETPVFCPCHGIAGTLDLVAERDGLYTLIDLKTGGEIGKPPYQESAFQLGAYVHAAEVWLGLPIHQALIVQAPKRRPEKPPYLAVYRLVDHDAALAGYLSAAALAEALDMKLWEPPQ